MHLLIIHPTYAHLYLTKKTFFLPPIFNIFNIIDVSCALRQKAGGACVYMPHNAYWPAGFEVTPPPKVDSPAAKII